MVNRRTLLTAVAGAKLSLTAGCVGGTFRIDDGDETNDSDAQDGDEGSDPAATNDHGHDSLPDDFSRSIEVTVESEIPDDIPVAFDLVVVDETMTAEHPAILEVAATNKGDDVRTLQTPFYKGSSNAVVNRGLLLYSVQAPDGPGRDYTPRCVDETDSRLGRGWTDEDALTHELAPGETGTDELVVIDDPTVDECFPTGDYLFNTTHYFTEEGTRWSFTLTLTA